MTDDNGLRAYAATKRDRHITAKGRMFPARHTRGSICIEIIGRRGIGQADEPDVAEAVHRHQRFPPGARVPTGDAYQVPYQPRPEERPDMGKVALKVRMHALKYGAGRYQTNSDRPHRLIPERDRRHVRLRPPREGIDRTADRISLHPTCSCKAPAHCHVRVHRSRP